MLYRFLADLVLIIHALYVVFIVGGFILILLGGGSGWAWVRNFKFRMLHLAAIGIVALQSWLEVLCPLTTLEMYLRDKGGQAVYTESFVAHWLHELLFYEAPAKVFTTCYSLFGFAVILAWFFIPPFLPGRPREKRRNKGDQY